MKKILMTAAIIIMASVAMGRGRIMNSDVASLSDIKSAVLTTTGDVSSGSACIANPASVAKVAAGQYIYDSTNPTYIPDGTTVVGIGTSPCTAGQIKMSANAAGTSTGDTITVGGQASQLVNDSKIWMTSVTPPQQLSTAVTAGLIGGGGGNSGKNYLSNASFEGGNSGWTITGATNAVNTSDFHDGAQSLTLTPTGAGSILQSVTPTTNLKGSNLESGLWVKTTKTDVENCSYINAVEIECQKVAATGEWVYVPANAAGPAQGTSIGVKLKWGSTGGSIIVDMGYAGGATNLTTIAQAKHVGTLKYAAAVNCVWQNSAGSYAGFPADTDCSTPTVTGDIQAPSTKIPAFKMNVTSGGIYRITIKAQAYGPGGTSNAEFRLTDGTDNTEICGTSKQYSGVDITPVVVMSCLYKPSSSGLKTVEIQSKTTASSSSIVQDETDLIFEVEQFPSQSQLAVNSLQSDYGLTAWTPTFTTVTPSVVEMYHSKQGEFLYIQGKIVHAGGTGALTFTLPNGLVASSSKLTASANYQVVGTGSITTSTLGSLTILAQAGLTTLAMGADGFGGGGNAPYTGAWGSETMTFTAKVPIEGWMDTQRAPTLVGSVTSGAQNAERIERAKVTMSGSCVVSSQSGTWLTSPSYLGAGQCTFSISPAFSENPACTCGSKSGSNWLCTVPTSTTSTIQINTGNHTAYGDADFDLICIGPK